MAIWLANNQSALPIRPLAIKRRLGQVLRALGRPDDIVSLCLTDDAEIKALNHEFRGLDQPTNVLSFPSREGAIQPGAHGIKGFLGDVAISAETIVREASELDIPCGQLLYFYIIHGILHLIGYDHTLGSQEEAAQEEETERLMGLIAHDL
jgi:probable rRNA maturation factor